MEEAYDVVVLGTSVTQSLIAVSLCKQGLNVLQVDRNSFYGGQEATLSWKQLCKWFNQEEDVAEARRWNVDLIPLLLEEHLLSVLDTLTISEYIDYVELQGTFIVQNSQLHDLSHFSDWLLSPDFRKFLVGFDSSRVETWAGLNLTQISFGEVVDHFGLSIGETLRNISGLRGLEQLRQSQTYAYLHYGTTSVVEACSRLSAVYGGTLMLGQTIEVEWEGDKVTGVRLEHGRVGCKCVVSDAVYVSERTRKRSTMARAICVLRHPVGTVSSGLVIVPESHTIYMTVLSSTQDVCPPGYWVAVCCSEVETEAEMKPAYDLLQPIDRVFFSLTDLCDARQCANLWVTQSASAAPQARSVAEEVTTIVASVTSLMSP